MNTCQTCKYADTTLRDDDPVMECHLLPPMTMPDAPEIPDVDSTTAFHLDDDGIETLATIEAFAAPHRYPVITDTDWCSHHSPVGEPDEAPAVMDWATAITLALKGRTEGWSAAQIIDIARQFRHAT